MFSDGGKLQTKTTQMEEELERILTDPVPAEAVLDRARDLGVSERTLIIAKKNLGVISDVYKRQAVHSGLGSDLPRDSQGDSGVFGCGRGSESGTAGYR